MTLFWLLRNGGKFHCHFQGKTGPNKDKAHLFASLPKITPPMKKINDKPPYWFEHITIMKLSSKKGTMDRGLLHKYWNCPPPDFLI